MKKNILAIVILFALFPIINVNALSCLEGEIDVNKVENFSCSSIEGDKLTFKDNTNGEDYSNYFTYKVENKKATITISKSIKFDASSPNRFIKVSDGTSETVINVKNPVYTTTKSTTTTTTTTTKDVNSKELTVTLDPNDGSEKIIKTCNVVAGNDTCSITLPKLDSVGFNGWGTASTCKEGNSGTIKVDKNITYYACYENNNNETENSPIYLKTLSLTNKDTDEKIDFGTFSIKKTDYEFKVLYDVKNINVSATADENIKIDITGNEELKVGENEIIIKLTDENNKTNEYKLKVIRLKEGETISNIHYLKSLVVGGYNINFAKEKLVYSLTIPNDIDSLEITAIPENDDDTYKVIGKDDLIDGSQIKIVVTGQDGEETTYIINITKESKTNLLLIVAVGLIILLIIILIILIIIKSNKKKKNLNNNGPKVLDKKDSKNNIEVLNI